MVIQLKSHLTDVLVCELLAAVSALVEVLLGVDVAVLPHVVHGGVVLAARHAHDPLLAGGDLAVAEALLDLQLGRRRLDLVLVDDVVRVVVGDVAVIAGEPLLVQVYSPFLGCRRATAHNPGEVLAAVVIVVIRLDGSLGSATRPHVQGVGVGVAVVAAVIVVVDDGGSDDGDGASGTIQIHLAMSLMRLEHVKV